MSWKVSCKGRSWQITARATTAVVKVTIETAKKQETQLQQPDQQRQRDDNNDDNVNSDSSNETVPKDCFRNSTTSHQRWPAFWSREHPCVEGGE
jgi:hypothetical protein